MADPMTPEDEQRIEQLLAMHPALLQPEAIELRAEVKRLRAEVDAADRARDHVRKKNLAVDRTLTEALKVHVPPQKRPTLVEAANEAARLIRRQAAELERLRAERDRLAEQLNDIGGRVFQLFIDADVQGLDLNRMTPAELGDLVMNAIRKEAGR